ncbi:ATP-binding protein [Lentzea cavernae]|nr:ATP-binding protein [Lentzea cavernae]
MVVATPAGRLDLSSYPVLRDSLLKQAAREPAALLVRLGPEFETASVAMLSVFTTVWMKISEWTDVPVVLVAETDQHRHDINKAGLAKTIATAPDLIAAVELAQEQPLRRFRRLELPGSIVAALLAREAAREVCEAWDLTHLTHDALLVASELVENAVKHSRAPSVLRIELRRSGLSLALRDGSPLPPTLTASPRSVPVHRGLELVDRLCRTWGFAPTFDGGKVVWAVLALRPTR